DSGPNYTALLHALRVALDALAGERKQLSVTLYDNGKGRFLPFENAAQPDVDFYFAEAYLVPYPNTLFPNPHGTVEEWVSRWMDPPRSVPPAKSRLGVPLWGSDGFVLGSDVRSFWQLVDLPGANPCGHKIDQYWVNGLRPIRELTRYAIA